MREKNAPAQTESSSITLSPLLCDCIAYLKLEGMDTVGVFRIPGNKENVNRLKQLYPRGPKENILQSTECSVHDVASLLKVHLRELPRPLVPFPVYKRFLRAVRRHDHSLSQAGGGYRARASIRDFSNVSLRDISNMVSNSINKQKRRSLTKSVTDERARAVLEVALSLPKAQCACLGMLLQFLKEISSHSNVNRMSVQALAVIFAPTLMHTPDNLPPATVLRDMPVAIAATKMLIENAYTLPAPDINLIAMNTQVS